jgi:hypothetical protein
LYGELADILGALRVEGIPVIVLKGAYLAETVYEDRGLRSMRDLDLLVRKCDLSHAEATLFAMGYSRLPGRTADVSRRHHLPPLVRSGRTPVEIHWTIENPTEPFDIDVEGLWARATPASIGGQEVLALSPEDSLLHLCLHTAFHHQFVLGLRGCWDILETTRHFGDRIDWVALQERARRWGVEKYVCLTLSLAKELLGVRVPVEVLADLRPHGFDGRLISLARAEILLRLHAAPVSSQFARMWSAEQIRERVSVLAHTIFPSRKTIRQLYPGCRANHWVYPYYPVRWLYLLRKYVRLAWRVFRDDELRAVIRRENERAQLLNWLKSVAT